MSRLQKCWKGRTAFCLLSKFIYDYFSKFCMIIVDINRGIHSMFFQDFGDVKWIETNNYVFWSLQKLA